MALDLIVFLLGKFLSNKLFYASVAGTLYIRTKAYQSDLRMQNLRLESKKYEEDNQEKHDSNLGRKIEYMRELFEPIKVNPVSLVVDPVLVLLFYPL
jgi:hypothetical protein